MTPTEERILDVAMAVLGADPDAGMGEVATAARVVRRTVYGYFPTRNDLVLGLTRRAVGELEQVLADVAGSGGSEPERPADALWAAFIGRVWPLADRYRVVVALRRSALGAEIHALLAPVDAALAELVARGQACGVFANHLSAAVLGQVAWSVVFTLADQAATHDGVDVRAATVTSLLLLGVPDGRASELADGG